MASSPPPPGAISFDRVSNLRDVGTSINLLGKRTILNSKLLYRSARPDEASTTDRDRLANELNLHTILDLRSTTEHQQQDLKHQAQLSAPPPKKTRKPSSPERLSNSRSSSRSSTSSTSSSSSRSSSVFSVTAFPTQKIPSITYIPINFNGFSFSMGLMRQLAWTSSAKLVYLMAIGQRTDAISILGREVMAERGLVGLGIDSLTYCTGEILAVFKVLSKEANYPVLVHCTQGKDRTGLVVLLVLMLCGVDLGVARGDYMASERELRGEREEKLNEIRSIGLPDVFADCPEDWVETVGAHIEERYGGVEKYLARCGVTREMQKSVKRIMMCEEHGS